MFTHASGNTRALAKRLKKRPHMRLRLVACGFLTHA